MSTGAVIAIVVAALIVLALLLLLARRGRERRLESRRGEAREIRREAEVSRAQADETRAEADERAARAQDHERAEPLAEVVVIDADHGGLLDGLVADEQLLHLLGKDVLAAGDDHVVVAAIHEQATRRVEVAHVAG